MTKRILIGGLVGGIIMFIWGGLSHTVLQLGFAGMVFNTPNEPVLTKALGENLKEPGLYWYPAFDMDAYAKMSGEAQKKSTADYEKLVKDGPSGLILFRPNNGPVHGTKTMLTQLATDIVRVWIAAAMLALAAPAVGCYWSRVLFVGAFGLVSALSVNVPYWNWYGFPGGFTAAQLADKTIGFLLVGLFLAWLIKPAPAAMSPAEHTA